MKQSLLLVDGDPKSLRVLDVSLKKAGFDVVTAASDREALERIAERTPDLVISDAHAPQVDGFELCRRLKERPDWARVPIIFLTGQKAIEEKIRALELGVEEYLTKPVYIKEITTRVRILLQRQQKERLESRRADARTKFTGQLSDIGLVDLVQTIELNRKSGIIHLANRDGRRGAVYFRDGRVIDGEAGRLSGAEAVYRLFAWSDGAFEVEFKPIRRRDVIELSPQALLMEGMRRLDEWSRLLEGLPGLDAVFEVDYHVLAERLGEIPDEVNGLLRLFDGRRTFTQVIDDCDFPDLEAVIIIGKLLADGVIAELADGLAPASSSEQPDAMATRLARVDRWVSEGERDGEAAAALVADGVDAQVSGGDEVERALLELAEGEALDRSAADAAQPAQAVVESHDGFEAPTTVRTPEHHEGALASATPSEAAQELATEARTRISTWTVPPTGAVPDLERPRGNTIRVGYPQAEPVPSRHEGSSDENAEPVEPGASTDGVVEHAVAGGTLRGMTVVAPSVGGEEAQAPADPNELPSEAPTTRMRGLLSAAMDGDAGVEPAALAESDRPAAVSGEITPAPADEEAEDAHARSPSATAEMAALLGAAAALADEAVEATVAATAEEAEPPLRVEAFPEGRPGDGGTSLIYPVPESEERRSARSLSVVPPGESAGEAAPRASGAWSELDDVPRRRRGRVAAVSALAAGSALAFVLYRAGMLPLGVTPVPGPAAAHATAPAPAPSSPRAKEPATSIAPALPKVELPSPAPKTEPAHTRVPSSATEKIPLAKVEPAKAEVAPRAPAQDPAAGPAASYEAMLDACREAQRSERARLIVAACTKAVAARPASPDAAALMSSIAFAESDRGHAGEALRWARQAIALNPDHAEAYQVLGAVHQGLGNVGEARAAYKRYLELAPKGPDASEVRQVLGALGK